MRYSLLVTRYPLAILILVLCCQALTAQNVDAVQFDKEYAARIDAARNVQAKMIADKYSEGCELSVNVECKVIRFYSFSLVQITTSETGGDVLLERADGGKNMSLTLIEPVTVVKIPNDRFFTVLAKNSCGTEEEVTSFSTTPKEQNDPIDLNRDDYNVVLEWQKSGTDINSFLDKSNDIDEFSKIRLLQQLRYGGKPIQDKYEDLNFYPSESVFIGAKSLTDDCQCASVRVAMNYDLEPYVRVRSDGRISGDYGSRLDQRFRGGDIRADQYWAYEGPSRYQEMFVNTLRCVNAPYEFYWNRDAVQQGNSDVLPVDFTATLEFLWVCTGSNGLPSDCGCDREVAFEWDYESVVRANAEVISGGLFCGSNRNARASAVDAMMVTFTEVGNAESFEILSMQTNGQASECSQTYNGPTASEFLEFAFTVYQFTQDPPAGTGTPGQSEEQIQNIWQNSLISDAIAQVGNALEDPWLDKTPCSIEVSGQRRSLQQTGANRNHNVTIRPNTPVRVVLGAAGVLEASGLRKWETNASIYSSFRLAGIMQGGGSPDPNNDCCSPYVASWLLSTMADDIPGSASESNYQNATRAFFNLNGWLRNVWSETGHGFTYNGFTCPTPVSINVVPPRTDDFDDVFITETSFESTNVAFRQMENSSSQMARVSLYNINGQEFMRQEISMGNSIVIDSGNLPAGIYFLSATLSDGRRYAKKIILQ
ncbi:T9SS type A sorting domain-containing protein [Neolewinella agarilytica]|uniref:Por secretion system C-terminal sorting domain-containing protein n=1 Tax=Neolewinella agarilytica TaxID=478744 RepID=A0A1H9MCH8_9BACT|nr:T9SS type A sorting domain-containing protein [Neolewinella agarilytica]SER21332.1 Por secretion system C-terminal sorting domain-containing protein [Neolewinella agarilytica]